MRLARPRSVFDSASAPQPLKTGESPRPVAPVHTPNAVMPCSAPADEQHGIIARRFGEWCSEVLTMVCECLDFCGQAPNCCRSASSTTSSGPADNSEDRTHRVKKEPAPQQAASHGPGAGEGCEGVPKLTRSAVSRPR